MMSAAGQPQGHSAPQDLVPCMAALRAVGSAPERKQNGPEIWLLVLHLHKREDCFCTA